MRLADEYDDAQERGDVQKRGGDRTTIIPNGNNAPAVSDLGISSKVIFESRQLRDAERERPGVIGETLEQIVESGAELGDRIAGLLRDQRLRRFGEAHAVEFSPHAPHPIRHVAAQNARVRGICHKAAERLPALLHRFGGDLVKLRHIDHPRLHRD
jgi:hypothetical protein